MVVKTLKKLTNGKELELNLENARFSTQTVTNFIKINQLFDRSKHLTDEDYQTIFEDMDEEVHKFGDVEQIKIIKNGEEKLGGKNSIF